MKNFRQTMGVEGGNLAVPTTPKSDNAEMKVEKTPHPRTSNRWKRGVGLLSIDKKSKAKSIFDFLYKLLITNLIHCL